MAAFPGSDDILTIRLQQQRSELDDVHRCIVDPRVTRVAGTLLGDRFALLLDNADSEFRKQLDHVARGEPDGWSSFAKSSERGARIKREALALVLGALLREADLDGGIQRLADRIFVELSARTGVEARVVASVGESEFLDRTLELARTRFPDTSVWGLPILAHEFGHYVARVLPHSDPDLRNQVWPLADLLAREADADCGALATVHGEDERLYRQRAKAHMNEIFADVYATYALGSCHPLAAIVLRAKLGNSEADSPSADTETHPSWARRITTMYEALKAMSEQTGDPRHRLMAERQIGPIWHSVAGDDWRRDPLIDHARPQAARIVKTLIEHAPKRLRNSDEGQVPGLQRLLAATAPPAAADLPRTTGLFHVMEAAWNWRVVHWSAEPKEVARINHRAIALCELAAA